MHVRFTNRLEHQGNLFSGKAHAMAAVRMAPLQRYQTATAIGITAGRENTKPKALAALPSHSPAGAPAAPPAAQCGG